MILRHNLLSKLCLAVWGSPAHFFRNKYKLGFLGRFSPNPEDLGENCKFLPLRLVKWSILYTALAYLGEKVVLFETVYNCRIGHCILKRHQVDQCIDLCCNLPWGPGFIPPVWDRGCWCWFGASLWVASMQIVPQCDSMEGPCRVVLFCLTWCYTVGARFYSPLSLGCRGCWCLNSAVCGLQTESSPV